MSTTIDATKEYAQPAIGAHVRHIRGYRRDLAFRTVYFLIALAGAIFMIIPIFWMLSTALKGQGQVISIPPVLC